MVMVGKHPLFISCLATALTIKSGHLIASNNEFTTSYNENSSLELLTQNKLVDVNINDAVQFFIGRKNIEYSSLIYAQEYNQGIAGTIKVPTFNSQFKTFTAGTHTVDNNSLGIEDHNNRASGIIWEYQPLTTEEKEISFTTSYFSGESEANNHIGNAISVATEANAFNQTLQVRGEYAQSSFTTINDRSGAHNRAQQAQHFTIRYIPNNNTKKREWDIGIENKTVDADFQSVLNNTLANDKDTTRLFGRYKKNNWSTEFSIRQEKNNLNRKLSTTDNARIGTITGRYRNEFSNESKLHFLGIQDYSLHYNQSNKVQHYHWQSTSESTSPSANQNQYRALNLESRHHYNKWQWFYKIGRSAATDQVDENGHFYSNEFELGSRFPLNRQTTIDTKIRSLQSKKILSGLKSSETHYDINVHRILSPDTFSGQLTVNYHQRDTQINTDQDEQYQALLLSGNISQRLLKPKGIYPSIDISLSASYKQEYNAFVELDIKEYQALMSLKINLVPENNFSNRSN